LNGTDYCRPTAWRYRGLLPPEEGTVSGAPAWTWGTIYQWAKATGRLSAVAEFLADKTAGWRVVDGVAVEIHAGVVVERVSPPFPQPLPDGRTQTRLRFMAASDGQWYELSQDDFRRATGAVTDDRLGKALLAAGAVALGIMVAGEVTKAKPPPT